MTTAGPTTSRTARIEPLIRLATGGMAEIWLAREHGAAGLERFVVIKRLLPHLANEPSIVDMFVSEARFVARLVHPNVVQIHELGEDAQGYFLVMEYVEGCTVRELMTAGNKAYKVLPPAAVICIVEQACRGAHAAHELTDPSGQPLGLVHRDISPHNLIVGPSGDVKLLDFGIAKATALAEATRTGSLKGKCTYMSPEQCQAKSLDRRSDIFSLGIVLWELLVGERLFQRDSEFASMEAIVAGEIPMPSEERPELPVGLDAVVQKALAKRPDDRFQTASALRRALLAVADKHGLRPSRDALATELTELLGDTLAQRQKALQEAASRAPGTDHSALQQALVAPGSHSQQSISKITSRTHSDDVPTVIQRASSRPPPGTPPVPHAGQNGEREPGDDDATVARPRAEGGAGLHGADPATGSGTAAPVPLVAGPAATPGTGGDAPPTLPSGSLPSSRRWLFVGAALVGAIAAVLLFFMERRPESDDPRAAPLDSAPVLSGPPLRFAVAPTVEPDVMQKELAPFVRWLEGRLGRPVVVTIAASYDDCGEQLAKSEVDVGLLPPLLYVQTSAQEPGIQPVALRLYDGSRSSDGYLLMRDDMPLERATDLKRRRVCLVDRESTTGYLLPRIWMRDAGLDPDRDVETVLSGDHLAAMRDLADHKCDAAAVYSGAYLSAQQQGIPVGMLRVLTVTGRVPQDVIAASPATPKDVVQRLRTVLLDFQPQRDIDSPRIGAVLGISGFAAFEERDFALIRKAAAGEGLIPGAAGSGAPSATPPPP